MRGQFYLIGAVILLILFFVGLPFSQLPLSQSGKDVNYLLDNLKTEYPRALNLGKNASAGPTTLTNFTHFLTSRLADRLVNFSAVWVVAENATNGTYVNFTGGNYLGASAVIHLNISGTVFSLVVPNNSTNSTLQSISSVPYNITINFTTDSLITAWYVNKTNLYVYLRLVRESDQVVDEIAA